MLPLSGEEREDLGSRSTCENTQLVSMRKLAQWGPSGSHRQSNKGQEASPNPELEERAGLLDLKPFFHPRHILISSPSYFLLPSLSTSPWL
jgi:hypothetical protein